MLLSVEVELIYKCDFPCDLLLQIKAATTDNQKIIEEQIEVSPRQPLNHIIADEDIGERVWLNAPDQFQCKYQLKIEVSRTIPNFAELEQVPLTKIGGDQVKYLLPSRYCHLDKFDALLPVEFNELSGGKLVIALANWIQTEFTYMAGASDALTNAHDTFSKKQGVCRDYAHVLISMLRVSAIPARMVSAYAPNVSPPDFHALVEVYLEGGWCLIDPTGMSKADEVAIIGIGRDAADISFLTSYGFLTLEKQTVQVQVLNMPINKNQFAC